MIRLQDYTPDRLVSIIACVSNGQRWEQCAKRISSQVLPRGFHREYIPVRGAASICAGYNEGMRRARGRYKLYLHQDVLLLKPNVIKDLLAVFDRHPDAGIVGIAGSVSLPDNAAWYTAALSDCYMHVLETRGEGVRCVVGNVWTDRDVEAAVADGLLLMTAVDIPWREDLFRGWHMYDIAQCFEMRARGYHLYLPQQQTPWVLHDTRKISDESADLQHWRDVFLEHYGGRRELFHV